MPITYRRTQNNGTPDQVKKIHMIGMKRIVA